MLIVPKQSVANWLIAECLATQHTVNEKIRLYERKYNQSWEDFSLSLHAAADEDFERWDDYIEWKAYQKLSEELTVKLNEVKHGNFEVA